MMENSLGEKRSFKDRRKFCYTSYSPERRSGLDRRAIGLDRRAVKTETSKIKVA